MRSGQRPIEINSDLQICKSGDDSIPPASPHRGSGRRRATSASRYVRFKSNKRFFPFSIDENPSASIGSKQQSASQPHSVAIRPVAMDG
ncbi:hypothetical protein ACLOJK_029408 [Asimina triloba]